ncbi:MAG: universal stress protein [Thermoleophilia bacterium]
MANTIVVGYDGSEHSLKALDAAIELAKTMPDGEVMVACAQDRPGPAVGFRGLEFGVEEMWDKVTQEIERQLAEAAARVTTQGVKVATACTPDRPDVSIIKIARDLGARMIVVGTRGAGAREGQKSVLGSTTSRVLHEAGGIPVLVV